jgi:arylsulfatase A-like enzyme/uncharacterized membrane protein YbhN (UPF0104 family)
LLKILVEILAVAVLALLVARTAREPWRGRGLNLLKAWITVRAFWLLFMHPVAMQDGSHVVAWRLILDQLAQIDAATFWTWVAAATGIKIVGILASMRRWILLLRGQGIELPFRHIFGSFLIGRFIGTFLPSTAGLDGYLLYDASRFSGRTVEVTATKALEKVLGFSGIFLTFLVSLPFGISIFGDNAATVAAITLPLALALIGGLLLVLWFPGVVEWGLRTVPIPGKARLEGIVMRLAHAAAAYRHQKLLVLQALFLSWVVHFTTAAMYFFTALAIGAVAADFWQVTFASSIQIFLTVISPFTIAGEGIREAAQYMLLRNQIGAAAAIVSAALGFWAAEAPTLLGGFFWWARGKDYRPEYCRVNGEQVDFAEAARNAVSLESDEERAARADVQAAPLPSFPSRLASSAGVGLGAGVLSGLLIGLIESWVIAQGGFAGEAQVLWYGPLAYAALLGALGAVGGAVLAVLPMDLEEIRGWTPSLAMLAMLVPFGLVITLFRVRRDVYLEQMPPLPVLGGILAAFGVLALLLFLVAPRLFRGRAGLVFTPPVALGLLGLVLGLGALAARGAAGADGDGGAPPAIPAQLSQRPNLILIMVDTLRADHLSCYGADVATPNICSLVEQGGTLYDGFAHASWTKPSTATLLTSLVPSTHKTMSKPAVLGDDADLVSEVVSGAGYATGGIVSNINLTPSFGFDQGFDEFHYLGPDYLAGALESSSKLILYQIARKVWFKVRPGLRFGDFYQDSAVVNDTAFDWLERHRDARFFLFLHYMDPHDPYFAHPYDGTGVARVSLAHPPPEQAEELRALYKGEIEYLDRNVGELFARLKALGLWDDAVIVLTADHGEEFHEHGGWWHGLTLYDEQIHVPLLVKWPAGQAGAPARGTGLARHIDVAPTLAALAGAEPAPAMQGVDLRSAFPERLEKDRLHLAEEDHEGNVVRALRTETWKYIEANEGNPRGLPTRELFDVAADPGETRNQAESQRELAARFEADAAAAQQYAETGGLEGQERAVSKAECERLAVLGYMSPEDCEKLN